MIFRIRQKAARAAFVWLLLGVALAGLGVFGWQRAQAALSKRAAAVTRLPVVSLPLQTESIRAGSDGERVELSAYEGVFDPRTKQMTIQTTRGARAADGRGAQTRVDPNAEVPRGDTGFTFSVVNSSFFSSGELAGNISGEIQLVNRTGVTLYNTRLVFTRFKLCPATGVCDGTSATQDASTTPGVSGFAYYNDGLIPFGGRLHVSRAYGDLAPSATSNAVWTFNVSTTPARFFFSFVVLADIGVAAESVYPAAVQVSANSGTDIVIRGRGFTGAPVVSLLDANRNQVAALGNVTVNSETQIIARVPQGTAPGLYGLRVTLAGGTPGGLNSSALLGRLTVTGVPDAAHTITGTVSSLSDTGPYLVGGNVTINSALNIQPGTVFYVNNNARVSVGASGNLTANGGVPGVPNGAGVANPAQIVFTALRSPGAAFPSQGAWAGIDATAAAATTMVLRNVVVEYGGNGNVPNLDITGSGRTLRFTDSILRHSAGTGLAAGGAGDNVVGFARNRIEYNGQSANTPGVLLSANAALGLYELPAGTPVGTNVGDPLYFYSSGNTLNGNNNDAIQIGTDDGAAANDFTRSGVLVGQGMMTPLQIRGSSTNPAIIGVAPPAPPVELVIGPAALIQLAGGMDLQAGDYGLNRVGGLAANGFAGVNQVNGASRLNSKFIVFDKLPFGGRFGALFFSRSATASSLLNFVQIRNGGAGVQGSGEVIADGFNLEVRNSQLSDSETGGIIELNGAVVTTVNTTVSGTRPLIDTIAGGVLGDGNVGAKATLVAPVVVALDPLGRGVYFADLTSKGYLIRFLNTTRSAATIGGIRVAGGTLRNVAGGGADLADNVPGLSADLGTVTGLATSVAGDILYFIDSVTPAVRLLNVSTAAVTVGAQSVGAGRVATLSADPVYGSSLSGLAVRANGEVLVADPTALKNRIYKIAPTGGSPTVFAGNGMTTVSRDTFSAGTATNIPLLQPRALLVAADGSVYIADTGHARVIRVDQGGQASLVIQFTPAADARIAPYDRPPFPSGLAIYNNKLHIALGSAQQIVTVESGSPVKVTGSIEIACDYSSSNCGDGGPVSGGTLYLNGSSSSSSPPLASIVGDSNGIFVCDQGPILRGRLRYLNLSNAPVEVAGVNIPANSINTVAGAGFPAPFDNGLATSAELSSPSGVAVDPTNGNLWISDTLSSRIRYVNRLSTPVTLFAAADPANRLTVAPGTIISVNRDVGSGPTDGVPALQAGFDTPQGLVATAQGLFIIDTKKGPSIARDINRRTSVIRFINTSSQNVTFYGTTTISPGFIGTIAGGSSDSTRNVGDQGDATEQGAIASNPFAAKFVGACDLAIAPNGDFYIADVGNKRVRKIQRANGTVTSLMLEGAAILALNATAPNQYTSVLFDSAGRLLVLDHGTNRLLREKTPGSGSTANGFDVLMSGNPLNKPRDMAFDLAGNLYVSNSGDHKILRLTISGNTATSVTYAGTIQGYFGDGGLASAAQMNFASPQIFVSTGIGTPVPIPSLICLTTGLSGEIIFTDTANGAVRRIR
jgi:hypothetical protein